MTRSAVWLAVSTLLAAPLLGFFALQFNPSWDVALHYPTEHFYIVSVVALLSGCVAGALMIGVESVRTTRNLFLALGFLGLAMIFATHGLSTPGFLVGEAHHPHESAGPAEVSSAADAPTAPPAAAAVGGGEDYTPYGVILSAALSEVVAAFFIFLSVIPEWSPAARGVQRSGRWLMPAAFVVFAAYMAVTLWRPEMWAFLPLGRAWEATLASLTAGLLAFAAWRYWRAWRLTRFPAQFAMVAALILLAQSNMAMFYGTIWHLSWWGYHSLMLAAFLVLIGGWALEWRRAGSLVLFSRAIALRDRLDRVVLSDPATLEVLEFAIGEKDPYTASHMGRVAEYSVAIAREMGLDAVRVQVVETAGRIHDIGKIGVPDAVLLKPGALTAEEYEQMKHHTLRGERLARTTRSLASVAAAVRSHHERFAGGGYPDGVGGEAIPIEARIIAVADTFDALTSPRVYRAQRDPLSAFAELQRVSGSQLDPRCVVAFGRWLERQGVLPPGVCAARAAA